MSDAYFGPGTTSERVQEALERAPKDRERRGAAGRAEVDKFFGRLAEERKRAEAS